MKKIIALALALIMALSMASVAFAAATPTPDKTFDVAAGTLEDKVYTYSTVAVGNITPGSTIELKIAGAEYKNIKISEVDFTTGALCGAAMIDSVKITKEKDAFRLVLKENFTMYEEDGKAAAGEISFTVKNDAFGKITYVIPVTMTVNNTPQFVTGAKKIANANDLAGKFGKDTVTIMDEDGGYVYFVAEQLTGTVKMNKDEKVQLIVDNTISADDKDAIEEYLGEDYEAIVEFYTFEGTGFKNEVAFKYNAYEEDDHFFYAWDGETMKDLGAKFNDDEEVNAYEFTGAAEGILVVTDTEIVAAAEETKNPDTGANDVVGVAAALAVVSLVAAGAVSLKK